MDAAAPRSSLLRFLGAAVLVAGAVAWAWEVHTCWSMGVTIRPGPADRHERLLPYDRGNPVFYDNDFANDYVDWYLMAAASAGELRYRGISTSSSVAPFNRTLPKDYFLERCVGDRARIVQIGRRCGLGNVPNPVAGPLGYLVEPGSGRPEDTRPLDSPGSRASRSPRRTGRLPLTSTGESSRTSPHG
jgi:hypothetical protein